MYFSNVYGPKLFRFEVYPTCVSSKRCAFILNGKGGTPPLPGPSHGKIPMGFLKPSLRCSIVYTYPHSVYYPIPSIAVHL